jgi:uncharacterized protein
MAGERIRDPLHDLIEFDTADDQLEKVLWEVIQTRPFQRLRRVKQLGFSDFVFPGAAHSRFAHSVGVFHTARRLMQVIRRDVHPAEDSKIAQALAAALVHDLGHGPFSHAFEPIGKALGLKMADHELVSDSLVRDSEVADALRALGSGFPNDVADVISGRGGNDIYRAVVSSQFDADRLDYVRRDRMMTGTQHAGIDYEWLMANITVGAVPFGVDEEQAGEVQTFVLGPKAIYAAEGYVLGLFQLYPTVFFHKTTRGAEKLFAELFKRIVSLVQDGSLAKTGLPKGHPLVKFAESPDEVESALALDDTVVWGALPMMAEADDETVADLALRLRDRRLYKCVDVRAWIAREKGDDAANSAKTDKQCAAIEEKLYQWSGEKSTHSARILIDAQTRSPYKRLTESKKGPLNQINIQTLGGHLVDLAKRSKVVGELEIYKMCRAYHAKEDGEAKEAIEHIIRSEVET